MRNFAVIATHHKTGTVWMRKIFQNIAALLQIDFLHMKGLTEARLQKLAPPLILFNDHSDFTRAPWILSSGDPQILHVIRDPRDIILSAMRYHRTSSEQWLHRPRSALGNMTYQQKLNSLPGDYERYLFEMRSSARRVIRDLKRWNYDRPNCFEARYETLMRDSEMVEFDRIFLHLGFEQEELKTCRRVVWKHSLFGKMREKKSSHIKSGEVMQWPRLFDSRLGEAFIAEFGEVLIELGYERDHSWLDRQSAVRAPTTQDDLSV